MNPPNLAVSGHGNPDRTEDTRSLDGEATQVAIRGGKRSGRQSADRGRLADCTPARAQHAAASLPAPGTRINQYVLLRELGRGGMGAVYLARDTALGRLVAIKILICNEGDLAERFLMEARATARCVHENIVVVHEVGMYRNNPFLVLEYVEGQQLTLLMDGQVLPPHYSVSLIVPVVRALICAHAHGIVHRDLKPDNVLVTPAGAVKIVDFGIAKRLSTWRDMPLSARPRALASQPRCTRPDMTDHGMIMGTLSYMSPEQWNADEVDERTDIWSVGIILYQMVTGRHPLAPLKGRELAAALAAPLPPVRSIRPDVPAALAAVIDHCLATNREQRMDSASALLAALGALAGAG